MDILTSTLGNIILLILNNIESNLKQTGRLYHRAVIGKIRK